jgi:PAS domain S-box-containing protein
LETKQKKSYPFLQGGGEMGERTRKYDWSQTPVGSPAQWPQSLRTTVSNLLRSKFPMFLWWGDEMIQFYNDAYRPSMGSDGKHPVALGQKGADCWQEIWPVIYPLIQQVRDTGEATWMEDQLIPIYRNGQLEDVWWTFSYSLVRDDNDGPGGILVTCMETTEAVLSRTKLENSQKRLHLALEKLQESEARFRNIIEQAPFAIALTRGEDFIIENINSPMLRIIHKKDKNDVLGKSVIEILPELKTQNVFDILLNVLKNGETFYGTELEAQLANEGILQRHYFNITYSRVIDKDGIAFVLHMAVDVTNQVLAKKKAEESDIRYQTLFESMDQGFCIIEMIYDQKARPVDYRFLELNPVFEKQTGLKDAAGKTIRQLAPQHEQHWFDIYGKIATTGEPVRFVQQAAALNRWYDVYAFRVGEEGAYKVAVLFTDITEQKNAEQALRHSEHNLRNMILQAPVAMAILKGSEFVVEIANDRMYELWGRKREDLVNKSIFEGLPEVRDQGYEELLAKVFTTGKTFSALGIPVTLPRNGSIEMVYINLLYEAFREADGGISGVMAVATDVTEQVLARQKIEEVVEQRTSQLAQANEDLQKTNKELQRSNQNLEEFAHAASHDLKEPIRKIHFFTQHLKDQLASHLKDEEQRSFSRIVNATQRMGHLIDDLLLYSHVSQRPHETESVDLNEKLHRVLEDLELDIEEKKAVVHVGRLPVIHGYKRQLQQLFQNLLSNSLKYSKAGVPAQIDITAEQTHSNDKSYHLIKVKDNGIGFEQQYEDKIFQMFSRLHGKSEYSGTGVGLSIAKKVVENHNGFIRVQSKSGEGSTFEIYLPV